MRDRHASKEIPPPAVPSPVHVPPSMSPATGSPPGRVYQAVNAFWDGGGNIVVVSRDEDGRRRRRLVPAEHSCFVRAEDLSADLERVLRSHPAVSGIKHEGTHVRLKFRSRDELRMLSDVPKRPRQDGSTDTFFERAGIQVYEADVHPVRRWLTDNEVTVQSPRRCYLDLETDSRVPFSKKETARVLCWAVIDDRTGAHVSEYLCEDTDAAERVLLTGLWHELDRFDQVGAWYGDGFDFPVLKARCMHLGLDVVWNGWLWIDHLEVFRKFNMSASESGDEKQSMALNAVAMAVLGEGKLDVDASKTYDLWVSGEEGRRRLQEYNIHDADLMRRIEERTGYLELLTTLAQACHVFPDSRGASGMNYVEGFLLKLARSRGLKFKTQWRPQVTHGYEGAFVLDPTRLGVVRDVHVADFTALYPSIIQSWNMSPETIHPWRAMTDAEAVGRGYDLRYFKRPPRPAEACEVPGYGASFYREPRGLLAEAVTELRRLRKHWNDLKATLPPGTQEWKEADRRSAAYKIAANTFYGVVGSPLSRFFSRDVAEAVTQAGGWLLKTTMRAGEQRGIDSFYGDTDSTFSTGVTEGEFRSFVDWCNHDLYPPLLEQCGCPVNEIKLAYEKQFDILVMVSSKRYAGRYAHYKGTRATADSKPEIKGLEFKRGDSVRLARRLQGEIIDMLLAGAIDPTASVAAFKEHLETWRKRVIDEELDVRDLLLSKRLTRDTRDYKIRKKKDGTDAAQPPHVQVAKVLKERGEDVTEGVRIDYVVVDGSCSPLKVIPAADYDGHCDRFYLWESLVYPPTERVLAVCFPADASYWRAVGHVRPKRVVIPKTVSPAPAVARSRSRPGRPGNPGQGSLSGIM